MEPAKMRKHYSNSTNRMQEEMERYFNNIIDLRKKQENRYSAAREKSIIKAMDGIKEFAPEELLKYHQYMENKITFTGRYNAEFGGMFD